jgi:peptidoglycan/LPS O-acetylase OafA/YrhL
MVNQLTFTRFIAAFSIVVFHYGMLSAPFDEPFLQAIFSHANLGVGYFFILSGFVMVVANSKRDSRINVTDYYVARVARIYPVYILAVLITSCILFFGPKRQELMGLFLNAFVIQAWIPKYAISINSPGWSLSVEFFFYILFPFLFNGIYRRCNIKIVAVCILIFWFLTQVFTNYMFLGPFYKGFPSESHNLLFYFPVFHLSQFLLGNLAGFVFLKYRDVRVKGIYLILISLLILVCLKINPPLQLHNGLMAILFVPFILALSLNRGLFKHLFEKKICIILGEVSYSLYILQFPVFIVIRELFKNLKVANPTLLFCVFFVVLITCAFASYYIVEIPFRDFVKRLKSTKEVQIKTVPKASL